MSERKSSRRTFMKTVGAVASVGLCSTIPASAADISDAPLPDGGNSYTYATMGTDENNPTAILYGNFKCPYTQKFVREGNLEAVLNEYVTAGDLNLQFRALAYQPPGTTSHGSSHYYISDSDPLISEATLGVWDVSPDDYWAFFNHMFSDLISGNVSHSEMEDRMQSAGVDSRGTITDRASSDQYTDEVKQNRHTAGDYGVSFTPTLVLDGDTIAPHHDTDDLLNWIGRRISNSDNSASGDETDHTQTSNNTTEEAPNNESTEKSGSTDSSSNEETGGSDQTTNSSEPVNTSSASDNSSSSEESNTETGNSSEQSSDAPKMAISNSQTQSESRGSGICKLRITED